MYGQADTVKTGMNKCCGDCKRLLPLDHFAVRKGKNARQSCCRICQRIRWRKWNDTARKRESAPRGWVAPRDFLPMGRDVERVALVYPIGYREAA